MNILHNYKYCCQVYIISDFFNYASSKMQKSRNSSAMRQFVHKSVLQACLHKRFFVQIDIWWTSKLLVFMLFENKKMYGWTVTNSIPLFLNLEFPHFVIEVWFSVHIAMKCTVKKTFSKICMPITDIYVRKGHTNWRKCFLPGVWMLYESGNHV